MKADNMKLPGVKNVGVTARFPPNLMEIADPVPELWRRIDQKQLVKVVQVSLKHQKELIGVEINRLKIQQEVIGEMEDLVGGFKF